MDIQEIARRCDANPNRLERVMRLLASHHIFTSPKKRWFANNRHSLALDTGKSAEELPRELSVQSCLSSPSRYPTVWKKIKIKLI
jgi:hypothetical protein